MLAGLARLHFQHGLKSLVSPTGQSTLFFYKKKKLMIKLSMFNKLKNFNKFTKLSKNFGELDDKLIIQHFHYIHTLTYTMYSSNFNTFKNI